MLSGLGFGWISHGVREIMPDLLGATFVMALVWATSFATAFIVQAWALAASAAGPQRSRLIYWMRRHLQLPPA